MFWRRKKEPTFEDDIAEMERHYALLDKMELEIHEFALVTSCAASMMAYLAYKASHEELQQIAKDFRRLKRTVAQLQAVTPPVGKRGIGFVVWMIARRRWLAAPPGTTKLKVHALKRDEAGRPAVTVFNATIGEAMMQSDLAKLKRKAMEAAARHAEEVK